MRFFSPHTQAGLASGLLLLLAACPPSAAQAGAGASGVQVPPRGTRLQPSAGPARPPPPPPKLAFALAAERRGDLTAALVEYDRLLGAASPTVRAFVEQRVRTLGGRVRAGGLSTALARLGGVSRVAALLRLARAERLGKSGLEAAARQALARAGEALTPDERRRAADALGRPDRIGILAPLSGKYHGLGRELIAGALLAADLVGRTRGRAMTVLTRDSEKHPADALASLARAGVVAVVGVPRSSRARLAAPVAERVGLPLLTLAGGKGIPALGRFVLRLGHTTRVRAAALAAHLAARKPGARVALVYPETGSAKRATEAFAQAAAKRGLVVVGRVGYPAKETTVYRRFLGLAGQRPDAVFVAETAGRLEMIAPQIALAGLRAVAKLPRHGRRRGRARRDRRGQQRAVLLYALADGATERLVSNAGTAVAGAILAPGFYPDATAGELRSFVSAFQRVYGRAPTRWAALAYLGVLRVRTALLGHARGRRSLQRRLAGGGKGGLRWFDAGGESVTPPRLYRVAAGRIVRLP